MGTASENISHLDEAWGCGPHKIPFLGSPDHKVSWKVQDVGLAIKARYPGTLTSPLSRVPTFSCGFFFYLTTAQYLRRLSSHPLTSHDISKHRSQAGCP